MKFTKLKTHKNFMLYGIPGVCSKLGDEEKVEK